MDEAADRLSDLALDRRLHELEQRLTRKLGGQKSFHGKFRPTLGRINLFTNWHPSAICLLLTDLFLAIQGALPRR